MIFVGTFDNGQDLQTEVKKVIDEKMSMCWEYKKTHITSAISVVTTGLEEKVDFQHHNASIVNLKTKYIPTQKEEIYHSAWVEFMKD